MVNNQKELLGFMSDTTMGSDHSNDLYGGDIMSTALVHHDPWDELKTITLNEKHLAKNHIVSGNINAPAHAAFDVLRTRLLHTLKDRGWNRVAITSPTKGCGKTFVAVNLALSLSRRVDSRTVLLDMNLRNPSLAKTFGISHPETMRDYLSGSQFEKDHLYKVNSNLAIGLNSSPEQAAAELLQSPRTKETLEIMQMELRPEIVLYDMPSVLHHDDLLSFLPQIDGVLLVIGGGQTKASEIREVEKLLNDQAQLLGVVLNRDEGMIGDIFNV